MATAGYFRSGQALTTENGSPRRSHATTEPFRILLGHAMNDGQELEVEKAPMAAIQAWGQQAHHPTPGNTRGYGIDER